MRKLITALLFFAVALPATHLDVKDETVQEEINAMDQFSKWGNGTHRELLEITWRKDGGSPWTARVYDVGVPGTPLEWEEVDYPRLMLAVKAVEQDFEKYPKGHKGAYKEN